jgi:hypothetical protein
MATVVEGLDVDRATMARNLHGPPDLGESASLIAALLDQHGKAR